MIKLKPLYEYFENFFSQNGEDGIISFIFENLNINSGLLLEVGAHDGVWCSNTYNLFSKSSNFTAILIESDYNVFQQLKNNMCQFTSNTDLYNCFIEANPMSKNSLDNIILNSKFNNKPFVLASIDIDGEDYNVWKSLIIKPIILIIECPIFLEKTEGKKNIIDYIELGKDKGYVFLGMSGKLGSFAGNLFFLDKDYENYFELSKLEDRILLHNGMKCDSL